MKPTELAGRLRLGATYAYSVYLRLVIHAVLGYVAVEAALGGRRHHHRIAIRHAGSSMVIGYVIQVDLGLRVGRGCGGGMEGCRPRIERSARAMAIIRDDTRERGRHGLLLMWRQVCLRLHGSEIRRMMQTRSGVGISRSGECRVDVAWRAATSAKPAPVGTSLPRAPQAILLRLRQEAWEGTG